MEKNQGADEWGPATRVQSGSTSVSPGAPAGSGSGPERRGTAPRRPPATSLTPAQSLADISARAAGDAQAAYRKGVATRAEPSTRVDGESVDRRPLERTPAAPGRGLPAWQALVVLVVIAAIGGIFDIVSDNTGRVGFNYGIVLAAIVAMVLVRRSGMFPVIIAPPIVYTVASVVMLYARSGGLSNRKVLYDAAANWLVYGFPAIAAATAAVLLIAGIRLLLHK